ncbi:MAG: heterodisulfide reductase-related iron-sulfur binding cluster, partial [Promethearchaeota archaeon]
MTFSAEKCMMDTCGMPCLTECYFMDYSEEEAKKEFKKLINGEPSPVTGQCITCCACNMRCPESADPFDLISRRMEETGTFIGGERAAQQMQMANAAPSSIRKGDPGKPIMNLCTVNLIQGSIEGQLFDGITTLQGGKYFCQIGGFHAGIPSMVRENAQRFIDNVAEEIPEDNYMICFHDDCFMMLDHYAKDYGIDVPFKYIHIIEYLRNYVRDNPNKIKKLNMKVAYHQPCASRINWDSFRKKDKMLDELFELLGVERVDRKYDRENAMCCTAVISPEDKYWKMNLADAKEAGAEAMVFLCPICCLYLRSKAKAEGLEPYFLSNLVREALGEELPKGRAGKVY